MCALLAGDVAMEGHLGLSRHTAPQARSNCGQTMCVGVCVCLRSLGFREIPHYAVEKTTMSN